MTNTVQTLWDTVSLLKSRRTLAYAGAGLILLGLIRRTPRSVLAAALGGALIRQGVGERMWNGNDSAKGLATGRVIPFGEGIRADYAITINRSRQDLYNFWRNFENLPRVMRFVHAVQVLSPLHSHWVVHVPAGITVEWDAEILQDVANERISWKSLENAQLPNAGSVQFDPAPNGQGTLVTIALRYNLPGGWMGETLAKLIGADPRDAVVQDLQRLKAIMEQHAETRYLSPLSAVPLSLNR